MLPEVDRNRCTGCGQCLEVCPPLALSLRDDKAELDAQFCEECGFCAPHCPTGAIALHFPTQADLTPNP